MKKRWMRGLFLAFGMLLFPVLLTMVLNGEERIEKTGHESEEWNIRITRGTQTQQIGLEEYLIGVVAAYLPEDSSEELLKAFMVMMRTNVMKSFESAGDEGILDETELSLSYYELSKLQDIWKEDFASNYTLYQKAAEATKGEVLICERELITPYYHICSAGRTRSLSGYPYLKAVESRADMEKEDFLKLSTLSKEEVETKLKEGEAISIRWAEKPAESFKIISADGLYVDVVYITVEEQEEPYSISGEQFAQIFGLASEAFSIESYKGNLRVLTKGNGSGIGLSLYGAEEMAKGGKGWRDILLYYYSGSEITKRY